MPSHTWHSIGHFYKPCARIGRFYKLSSKKIAGYPEQRTSKKVRKT